jgi:ABC-2 type transport system permease protein
MSMLAGAAATLPRRLYTPVPGSRAGHRLLCAVLTPALAWPLVGEPANKLKCSSGLAIGVLGVVITISEYATGSIRSTFAAAPQRGTVLAAKAAAFAAVAVITGIAFSFAAFFTGQAILSRNAIEAHLSDPATTRSVLGAGLYLAALGLLALGLGALIRHTAAAIAAVAGLVLVLPVLVQGLPSSWRAAAVRYLPSAAGQAIIGRTKFTPLGQLLSPWTGFALFCAYAAAVPIASVISLSWRDA